MSYHFVIITSSSSLISLAHLEASTFFMSLSLENYELLKRFWHSTYIFLTTERDYNLRSNYRKWEALILSANFNTTDTPISKFLILLDWVLSMSFDILWNQTFDRLFHFGFPFTHYFTFNDLLKDIICSSILRFSSIGK